MTESKDILFSEVPGVGGSLGLITLNRPEALNSLNHEMISAMLTTLARWAVSSEIKAVVVRAVEGRAFCAGGDIRMVYQAAKAKNPTMTDFFHDEYQLNRVIHHFPKPYIALLDGITMGGGVGISIHGSHRVATERFVFAMPETGIGFFPDVGGSYFLPRLPHRTGYYLGLTGARIKVDDCLTLGLCTHKVIHDDIPNVIEALTNTDMGQNAHAVVTTVLNQYSHKPLPTPLHQAEAEVQHCFSGETIEKIIERLQASDDSLCNDALLALQKKSPTSLIVTLQALNNGANLTFDDCMQQEFRLVTRFLLAHDFIEGIRAAIIDKDQAPAWQPNTLSGVDQASIEEYFMPLTKELV